MNLEDFKDHEKIYIDSAIFVSHHSKDAVDRKECTAFLSSVERGEINAVTSYVAIDETAYILLKFKAAEILGTDKHYKILDSLRHNKKVFDAAWEVVEVHIDFVGALREKNVLQIINQTADPLELKDLGKKYQLLPRDASHLGIMRRNMIKNIAISRVQTAG